MENIEGDLFAKLISMMNDEESSELAEINQSLLNFLFTAANECNELRELRDNLKSAAKDKKKSFSDEKRALQAEIAEEKNLIEKLENQRSELEKFVIDFEKKYKNAAPRNSGIGGGGGFVGRENLRRASTSTDTNNHDHQGDQTRNAVPPIRKARVSLDRNIVEQHKNMKSKKDAHVDTDDADDDSPTNDVDKNDQANIEERYTSRKYPTPLPHHRIRVMRVESTDVSTSENEDN